MQRYNLFMEIHKGLRALIYHTSLALQQTCFSDSEETDGKPAEDTLFNNPILGPLFYGTRLIRILRFQNCR